MKRWLLALSLICGPLLGGAIFFVLEAPHQGTGVYVETANGTYPLSGFPAPPAPPAGGAAPRAPVPSGRVLSFVVVGAPDSILLSHVHSARVLFFVVDDADEGFNSAYVAVPVTVRSINPRTIQVAAAGLHDWSPGSVAFKAYRDVLEHTSRRAATLEVMAALEIQDSSDGTRRLYPVRVGPP